MGNKFLHFAGISEMLRKFAEESGKQCLLVLSLSQIARRFEFLAMPILQLNVFRKSSRCPASEILLDYRHSHLTLTEQAWVEAHLDYCEFCNAELPLLDRYRFEKEEIEFSEIPWQLRKFAEEVLRLSAIRMYAASEVADHPHISH